MKVSVISPGPLTTIQDFGRFGLREIGMGTAGAMDQEAFQIANLLVNNPLNAAVLEMTLLGASLRFDDHCIIALTGADMQYTLDGERVPRYQPFQVAPGQVLKGGFAQAGCRGYLAIQGGFDVPMALGSRSTDLKCGIGGFHGRALKAEDILSVAPALMRNNQDSTFSCRPPIYTEDVQIRVIFGPQSERFSKEGIETFLNGEYVVTPDSDRMGMRLSGPAIDPEVTKDILSDGIVMGSIQVSSAGQPIILMADAQTTGGYAKIATVISTDLSILAQLKPGGKIHFKAVSVREAQRIYRRNAK